MTILYFFSTTVFLFYYINSIACQHISARKNAGCALLSNKIFCYGGYPTNDEVSLNVQHISLDLTQLHGITDLDDSKIQWERVTDVINNTRLTVPPRAYQGSAVVTSNNSYIMFGGALSVSDPFLNYNPQTYTWTSLQLDSNVNTTNRNTIVNMGDDIFWIWGGLNFPYFNVTLPNIVHVYDYKASKWMNSIFENNVPTKIQHTATLGLDNAIYVLGGTVLDGTTNDPNSNSNDHTQIIYPAFNYVRKFDTKSTQWSYFNATGHSVSSRVSHSTTQLRNRNQMIIYGGIYSDPVNIAQSIPSADYYIVFDYSKNTFQNIEFPNPPNSVNIRYGHFADIYIETYLVMAFGFIDENNPATSLSVLDVTDPYQPRWATSFSNFPTNSTDTTNGFRREYIVAIVVPLLLIVIAIFTYFYKKRKQDNKLPKDPFVLEESNSSLRIQGTDFVGSDNTKFAKLTINHEEGGYNKIHDNYPADNFCKPLENSTYKNENEVEKVESYNKTCSNQPINDICNPIKNTNDIDLQKSEYVKPTIGHSFSIN